ncbi:hypothetical protein ACWDSL_20220, partial [Streptomyces sp. NPDC000941]
FNPAAHHLFQLLCLHRPPHPAARRIGPAPRPPARAPPARGRPRARGLAHGPYGDGVRTAIRRLALRLGAAGGGPPLGGPPG